PHLFSLLLRRPPTPTLFPYTTLFRSVSYAQASQDLSVHQSQLRSWVTALAADPQHAFPGQGQMKPEQLEIAQLKREVIRLKAERDRKSTRLNSSHRTISYAVFCLKKK